jgi:hypothetical protein
VDSREATARRVKAAQALGGFSNAEALAAAAKDLGNLGLKRIRELQQKRGDKPRVIELRTIAEACGLPYEFFTIDFSQLSLSARIDERLNTLETEVRRLAAERPAPAPPGELGRRAEGGGSAARCRRMNAPRCASIRTSHASGSPASSPSTDERIGPCL